MKTQKLFEIVDSSPHGVSTKEVYVKEPGGKKFKKIRKARNKGSKLSSPGKTKKKKKELYDPFKVYAIRTDDKDLPVIEEITFWRKEGCNKKYYYSRPSNFGNVLYPYDYLYLSTQTSIGTKAVSDCYSRGWIFYSFGDAVRRLRDVVSKQQRKAEEDMEKAAALAARVDALKLDGVIDSY